MALPQNFIEVVNVVGAVLLHFLWQGVFIGGAYALTRPFFPTMSARYRLGLGALIALALCPIATLVYLWPESGVQSASVLPTFGACMLLWTGMPPSVAPRTTKSTSSRLSSPASRFLRIMSTARIGRIARRLALPNRRRQRPCASVFRCAIPGC